MRLGNNHKPCSSGRRTRLCISQGFKKYDGRCDNHLSRMGKAKKIQSDLPDHDPRCMQGTAVDQLHPNANDGRVNRGCRRD